MMISDNMIQLILAKDQLSPCPTLHNTAASCSSNAEANTFRSSVEYGSFLTKINKERKIVAHCQTNIMQKLQQDLPKPEKMGNHFRNQKLQSHLRTQDLYNIWVKIPTFTIRPFIFSHGQKMYTFKLRETKLGGKGQQYLRRGKRGIVNEESVHILSAMF